MRNTGYTTSAGRCAIHIGRSAAGLKELLGGRKTAVVTDTNVHSLYRGLLAGYDVVSIPPGETAKTLKTVTEICARFLEIGLDRSSFVVGLGGGVVTDISGLAASLFMRGIPFGLVPTTLLAQTDAAIGGKNGVNLNRYKNIIGVFNQPRFVLLDFGFLETLPAREFRNGAAEIIKHALIASPSLFATLEKEWASWPDLERGTLGSIVRRSIAIKVKIVQTDEKEAGERRKLNFGHTFGHALERVHRLRHGEAVSIGMVAAAAISEARGMMSRGECDRIKALLRRTGLPVRIPRDTGPVLAAMKKDKKRFQEGLHFVLLSGIGKAVIHKLSFRELEEHVRDLRQHR